MAAPASAAFRPSIAAASVSPAAVDMVDVNDILPAYGLQPGRRSTWTNNRTTGPLEYLDIVVRGNIGLGLPVQNGVAGNVSSVVDFTGAQSPTSTTTSFTVVEPALGPLVGSFPWAAQPLDAGDPFVSFLELGHLSNSTASAWNLTFSSDLLFCGLLAVTQVDGASLLPASHGTAEFAFAPKLELASASTTNVTTSLLSSAVVGSEIWVHFEVVAFAGDLLPTRESYRTTAMQRLAWKETNVSVARGSSLL
jgi:hypothetical protein